MIRWGIIGAGKIAHRFAKSLAYEEDSVLYAISGRSQEKMEAFQKEFPCEKICIGHENLLKDENVDAVYIALPHAMHKEWALQAMRAGKAVLCEKPAVMNAAEMEEIIAVSKETGVLFMEAQKSRFTPGYRKLKEMIDRGEIGEVRAISTSFCNQMPADRFGTSYHTEPGQGGCLLDGGIYCASWLNDFLGEDLKVEHVYGNIRKGVDFYIDARLSAGNKQGRLECAFDRKNPQNAVIEGEKGTVAAEHLHRCDAFAVSRNGKEERFEVPYDHDDFYSQIHHFVTLMKEGKTESDIMPLKDSLACAGIMDQIREYFTVYTIEDLRVLEKQEEMLRYESFTDNDAMELGHKIWSLLPEYDNGISIRIIRERDEAVMFSWLSDVKAENNYMYGEMKRQASLKSGHSSCWTWAAKNLSDEHAPEYADIEMMSGGAFPVRLKDGTLTATLCVSGLHEGKDHEIMIRALAEILHQEVPVLHKVTA